MKLIIAGIIFLLLSVIYHQHDDLAFWKQHSNDWKQLTGSWMHDYLECNESKKKIFDDTVKLFNKYQTCVQQETPL